MNGDVALNVLDQQTVNYIGNLVTVDHYIKNKDVMNNYVETLHNKFHTKIFIGEFGAPIAGINGQMNEDQQLKFVTDIIDLLSQKNYVIGLNYWVLTGGSTALANSDLSLKKVFSSIQEYFRPGILNGMVVDGNKVPIKNAEIYFNNIKQLTDDNGKYILKIPSGIHSIFIQRAGLKELNYVALQSDKITDLTTVLEERVSKKNQIINPEEFNILNWIMK